MSGEHEAGRRGAGGDEFIDEGASKLSLPAVGALILSLLCFLPGAGALGAVLAVGALVAIGRSGGRRRGVGLAVVALSIGLASTALWTTAGLKARGFAQYYQRVVAPSTVRLVHPGEGGLAAARAVMTSEASAATSDEDFAQFDAALRAHFGEFVESPSELGSIWETFKDSIRKSGYRNPRGSTQSFPTPLRYSKGSTTVFATIARGTWKQEELRLEDAFALLPGRKVVTLRRDGPAKREALHMGYEPVYGEAALPSGEDSGDGFGNGGGG